MASGADHTVDYLIIGSGAAGLSAALRAHSLGLKTLVVESSEQYGGSTAISGGIVWIPNNPQLPAKGIDDSREDALAYLRHITAGQVLEDRLEAYVDESVRMLAWMKEHTHLHLDALEHYADYYPDAPGGKTGGRSMEPIPFDGTQLGEEFGKLVRSHPQSQVMGKFGVRARDVKGFLVPTLMGKLRVMWLLIKYLLRGRKRKGFPRDTLLHAGNGLVGRLRFSLMERDIPLWLESPATELIIEQGRVVGAVVEKQGESLRIAASAGVLLAAGGFEQNQEMRDEFHSRLPSLTEWNAGNPHNKGAGIRMGMAAGGAVERMDELWWTPVTRAPRWDCSWVMVVEKSLPGSILVNAKGERFINEAAPYLDLGRDMYEHDAVPVCWLVFDADFRRDYPVGPVAPGYASPDHRLKRRYREQFFNKADSIAELAEKLELEPEALTATVERFNALADKGVDEDFGRGENASDRYYSDFRVKPNPCLRALRQPPFYAISVYAGDLGTKGGLVTDRTGRVLREDGSAVSGLYAAGNCSAAVMGPSYPGAGGTIGPALTFGFLAAEHAAKHQAGAGASLPEGAGEDARREAVDGPAEAVHA